MHFLSMHGSGCGGSSAGTCVMLNVTGTCNKQCDKLVADTVVTSVYGGKVVDFKIRHPDIGEAV